MIKWVIPFYSALPIFAQHLACDIHGAHMSHRFYGRKYREILDQDIRRSFLSSKTLREYRDKKLRSFIDHAVRTTPYYRKLFSDFGLSVKDIQTLKDLSKLPILKKSDVQDYFEDLQSDIPPKDERILINTSGTTGMPLNIYTTHNRIDRTICRLGEILPLARYQSWGTMVRRVRRSSMGRCGSEKSPFLEIQPLWPTDFFQRIPYGSAQYQVLHIRT